MEDLRPEVKKLLDEIEDLKKRLQFYEEYDPVTGLYNKTAFYDRVERILKEEASGIPFVIIGIDIQKFKLVNDLYGVETGDFLLKYFADSFRKRILEEPKVIGRMGADIFGVFMPETQELNKKTISEIEQIFWDIPLELELSPAIGIYKVEDRKIDVNLMCDRAILALNSVKGDYHKHTAVYEKSLRNNLIEEHQLLNSARAALVNKEFQIYFQPKCNMRTGKMVGAEALVRWDHPKRGRIAPGMFVPIFEKNGFVKELDVYVWKEAVRWVREWINTGRKAVPISVNVSRVDISGMDVCGIFKELIRRYQVPPELIEIEITESAYSEHEREIIAAVRELMSFGFTVLMDDFGSGYSSLNMLKDINVDILKIDMRFLDRDDRKSKDILESVVHMSKWLGLPVIAEGVETQNQVDFLLDIGCVYAQGYFFYRPLSAEQFEKLLENETKVDFSEGRNLNHAQDKILDFHDLFHEDAMSDRLLTNILGAIALYSFDGTQLHLLRVNAEYYRLVYFQMLDEDKEEDVFQTFIEEDRQQFRDAVLKVRDEKNEKGVEICIRRKQKERIVWIKIRLFYLSCAGGNDILYGALSDVTEHMENMEELRISEQRFRVAMEITDLTLFEVDIKKKTARFSEGTRNAYRLDKNEIQAPEEFIRQGTLREGYEGVFKEMYSEIYQGAEQASCVVEANTERDIVWNRITLIAVKDKDGVSVKAVGLIENITREKELEQKLGRHTFASIEKENRDILLSLIADVVSYGMIGNYLDGDYPLYVINEEMMNLLGYASYDEFITETGGNAVNIIDPQDFDRIMETMKQMEFGEDYIQYYRMIRKDGSSFMVLDKCQVVSDREGRKAAVRVCVDLTEQTEMSTRMESRLRKLEEKLQISENKFQGLFRCMKTTTWECELDGSHLCVEYPDGSGESLCTGGLSKSEMVRHGVHPDSYGKLKKALSEIRNGKKEVRLEILKKDRGSREYAKVTLYGIVIMDNRKKPAMITGITEKKEDDMNEERDEETR